MVGKRAGRVDDSAVPDIGALIRPLTAAGSQRELARRTGLNHQTISDLAANRVNGWPKKLETVTALADVLGVPVTTVVLAYARSLGLDVTREIPPLAQRLPPAATRLTASQEDAVLSVVRAILDAAEGQGAAVVPLPTSPQPAQPRAERRVARQPDRRGKQRARRNDRGRQ